MTIVSIMVRRVAATQGVVDAWRYRPFVWGENDCGRLAAAMLRALGHKPGVSRFGNYKTAFGAQKALMKRGFRDMADVIDSFNFHRIGQASVLPGDLVGFRHPDQPLGVGLAVTIGNGRLLAFMDNGDGRGVACHVFPPRPASPEVEYLAWRTDPV
jgi:hypothetical protein